MALSGDGHIERLLPKPMFAGVFLRITKEDEEVKTQDLIAVLGSQLLGTCSHLQA